MRDFLKVDDITDGINSRAIVPFERIIAVTDIPNEEGCFILVDIGECEPPHKMMVSNSFNNVMEALKAKDASYIKVLDKEFYDVGETAKILGQTKQNVFRLVKKGALVRKPNCSRIMIPKESVMEKLKLMGCDEYVLE